MRMFNPPSIGDAAAYCTPLRYSSGVTDIEELHIDTVASAASDDHKRDSGTRNPDDHDSRRLRRHRAKRRLRDALLVIIAVILSAIILVSVYFAISAAIVAKEVKSAAASVTSIQSERLTDDKLAATLSGVTSGLQQHINAAYAHTSNPVWALAGKLPQYGDDIEAIRTAVDALHAVANDALPLMAEAADSVDISRISMADSTVSVPGLELAAPKVAKANDVVQAANDKLQNIDGVNLGALERQLEQAQQQFISVAKLSDTVSRTVQLLPSMLGNNDPTATRTYLVLVQNNAEIRATGGISGSFGLVTVSNGKITMHEFENTGEFPPFDAPVTELTADEKNIYGDNLGRYIVDTNFTPDFPRTGQLAKTMWEMKNGGSIDGVISVDPVFLQRLLSVAGSVTVSEGGYSTTLDGTNAASVLLNQAYFDIPWDAQDAFFTAASKACFDRILNGAGNPVDLVKQAIGAADDGHLYIWSAHEDEQKLLAGTTVGGALVTDKSDNYMGGDAPQQVIGVYYNDSVSGKMDWYLKREVTDNVKKVDPNGSEEHEITIRMTNTLAADQASSLPDVFYGGLENGSAKGDIQLVNYLYVPAGGSVPDYKAGAKGEKGDAYALHNDLTVICKKVNLKPGESYEIKATVFTAPGSLPGQTVLRQTPLIQ